MNVPYLIGLLLSGLLTLTPIACAIEPASKQGKTAEEIASESGTLAHRQRFSGLAKKSKGPLRGWYLLQVVETYDGYTLDFAKDGETLARLCADTKRLIGNGDDALTSKMKEEHFNLESAPESPATGNKLHADRAQLLLKNAQETFSVRRITKMLDDAHGAAYDKRYDEARRLFSSAMNLSQTKYKDFQKSPGCWDIDDRVWEVATILVEQARYADAEAILKAILARDNRLNLLREFKRDGYARAQAADYFQLGYCAFMQKHYSQAEQNYKKALALRQNVYGKEHACSLRVMNHLARVYTGQNRTQEALALQKQTTKLPSCPICRSNFDVKPIAYGLMHGVKMVHLRQEVAVGGCSRTPGKSPNWYCVPCQKSFSIKPDKPAGK